MAVAILFRFEFGNAIAHPLIGIFDGEASHIHGAAGLKCIEVEVKIEVGEGLVAVVVVDDGLIALVAVIGVIEVHVDGVLHALLPPIGLSGECTCKCEKYSGQK